LIATAFLGISDTINVVSTTTQTIRVTGAYYFIQIFILLGLVLTLLSVIKHAKENGNKTKIVNVVDEEAIREIHNKQSLKGLFEEGEQPHHEHHEENE
jgi:phosphate/sulfate permease